MQFQLGKLKQEDGRLVQEIILTGAGFTRHPPRPGFLIDFDNPVHVKGDASLEIPFGNSPLIVDVGLKEGTKFQMFGKYADFDLSILDLKADSLRIQLTVAPPSGFKLGKDDQGTSTVVQNASGGTTPPPLPSPAIATREYDLPSEKEKLDKKYRWGWRILGIDKLGGTHTYANRLSKEYEMDWDKIKVTPDFKKGRYRVEIPPIKLTYAKPEAQGVMIQQGTEGSAEFTIGENGIGGASIEGNLRVGQTGGAMIGGISITVEILDIRNDGIVVLIGVNENTLLADYQALQKRIALAESIISRYHDLFNQGKFDDVWNEAHPEFRAAMEKKNFDTFMRRTHDDLGNFVSSEKIRSGNDPEDLATRVRIYLNTKFQKKNIEERFTIKLAGDKASLFGIGFKPPSSTPDTGASPP
jgi:hypothetical protein